MDNEEKAPALAPDISTMTRSNEPHSKHFLITQLSHPHLEKWLDWAVCESERNIEIRSIEAANGYLMRIYIT
jgi:hypothetical protein